MTNHPNRSAAKVEVTTLGQGHALVFLDGRLVAGISTDDSGRWIMRPLTREAGETQVAGPEEINVSGIMHNAAELNRAARLFAVDPAGVAAAWPRSGLRAQCKDAMDRLTQ